MQNLRIISLPGKGPEDIVLDGEGHVYCSQRDSGCVVRIHLASDAVEVVAETGGAPLGLEWMPDGRLLVCNADLGPQIVDVSTGTVTALPCDIAFTLCNNAHVLPDGTVLVSDSSGQYPLAEFQKDLIENTASGRLIKVSPDGQSTVLMDGLSFANGVVCIDEGKTALVAETGKECIHSVDIDSSKSTIFARTQGHPDNISIGQDGNIWVAIPSLPNSDLDKLHKAPLFLRKIAARLPAFMQPKPELCCRVVVFDPSGNLLRTYDGDTDIFNFVTGVREGDGIVALGSIEHSCIGIFDAD